MGKYVLLAHWGMDFDNTQWVESSQRINGTLHVNLTDDLHEATYGTEKQSKDWAKSIIDEPGFRTWRIEVVPFDKADDIKLIKNGQELMKPNHKIGVEG